MNFGIFMKRILIFSTAYFPFIGGAEVAVKEISDRLPDFQFIMITARLDSKLQAVEKVGNIEIHRLGKGNSLDKYRLMAQGASYASKLGHFDAIWGIMASYAGFVALRFKKGNLRVPFLLTLQEGDGRWDIYKHVWWCWPYFKQIFKSANRIQAISNYLAKWAKDLGAKCPIEVVPNGVDVEKFQDTRNKIQTNIQYPISNIQKIITVSRLVKKNGVGDLIKAMKFLDNDIHLLIVGDGILKNKLVLLVNHLGLVDRVHFLGQLSHDKLLPRLQTSDVFCRPSLSEGLGNGFLEAMSSGIPVVGTKVGGIPDFLVDNETGLFCEVGNSENIATNIKRILTDINLRQKLVENGKKLVQEKYNWNLIANKMKNIFDSL